VQGGRVIDGSAFANTLERWQAYRAQVQAEMIALLLLTVSAAALFLASLYRNILRPFEINRKRKLSYHGIKHRQTSYREV
jgi:hypothetical protein